MWDSIFPKKNCKKFDTFSDFFSKINILRFEMVLTEKILKNFD